MTEQLGSSVHVRPGFHAQGGHVFTPDALTDMGGIPVVSSPYVPEGRWLLLEGRVFVGEHDAEAKAVISAELVACTLGARHRPELVTNRPALLF